MSHRILVIEDDQDIAGLVEIHLSDAGYSVELASDGVLGLKRATQGGFDLIILDLMLPGMDGLEICKQIRSRSDYTPVLMLTAKTTEVDRVLGLELGADDYLTKPFSVTELVARVKAIFRRVEALRSQRDGSSAEPIRLRDLEIDPRKRNVKVAGESVELTAREFDLLLQFARHPGRVFSRAQLLEQVWGYGHDGYEHTVNSHINRLRAKIETDPSDPAYILTVWGVGYKMFDPSEA